MCVQILSFSLLLLPLLVQTLATAYPQEAPILSVNQKHLETIEKYMNLSVNPCKDFYGYACGNWGKHHPSGRYAETTGLIDHKINRKFVNFLDKHTPDALSHENYSNIYNHVWTYYRSCKREKVRNITRYLKIVRPAGAWEWPMLQSEEASPWPKEEFDWMLTLGKLQRYGLNGVLIEQHVLQTSEDATVYVLDLDKPKLEGDNKLPSMTKIVKILQSHFENIERTAAERVAAELLEFESRVEELLESPEENWQFEVTMGDLADALPALPWYKYLKLSVGQGLNKNYSLQIRNLAYFSNLTELIDGTDATIVCNYLMYKFIIHLLWDGTASFEKIDCLIDLRSKMDFAMNYIYNEIYYRPIADQYNAEVHKIFELLRSEFVQKIEQNRLHLNVGEQEYLRDKLKNMDINIGNMPKAITIDFIESYYSDLHLELKNYYKNHLKLLELRFVKEHKQLDRPMSVEEFFYITDSNTARSSTPFYLIRRNTIVVPFGFLQTPMFHKNLHDVFKMSLFGFLVAHELTHGFDASGVSNDFHGNWNDLGYNISENPNFVEALNCIQQNRSENIDERIADISGIRLAYDTIFGAEAKVNVLQPKFTKTFMKRLFFLNYAQFFCGNLEAIFSDHDSDNVRLQESLLNFETFAEVFECNLGDTMHPEQKCRLW